MKLPSGVELEITKTPFAVSRALFKAVIENSKNADIRGPEDYFGMVRVFIDSLVSATVEKPLWECMKYALYNKLKIDADTFEPEEAREDYLPVCLEVAHHNLRPFLKSPSVLSKRMQEIVVGFQESK